nr:amidase family protein [Verrucomicrobium spinosum]
MRGLKPTYGRVSRYGLVAFASSLDQIGPITKTVEDAALVLNHLCGKDGRDSTSLDATVPDFTTGLGQDIKGLRFGLPKEYLVDGVDARIRSAVETAITHIQGLGGIVEEISLPHTDVGIATYYVIAPAEASTNLSRFDGVRYGHRAENTTDVLDHYLTTRAEALAPR